MNDVFLHHARTRTCARAALRRAPLAAPLSIAMAAALATLLAGCAVGPDYVRPVLAIPQAYTAAARGNDEAAPGRAPHERYAPQHDIARDWWTAFGSPALGALVEQAFRANPSVASAQATLRAARENAAAQRGYFFPTLDAGYSPTRTKIAGNLGGNSPGIQGNGSVIETGSGTPASEGGKAPFTAPVTYNFHTAQVTVGYTPDVFGASRRALESEQAQASAERFQLEATYITLAANVVSAAFEDALLRRQLELVSAMVAADEQALAVAQRQRDSGQTSGIELAARRNALAQTRQQLPALRKQFEHNRNQLRQLAGIAPDADVPAFALDALHLPERLPLSLPSQLVEQRPDIRLAEEQLRAATAQVGVARAARLPLFTVSANAGGTASQLRQMFWRSGKFFDLTANLAMPLFDGGTLRHRERAASAMLDAAAADYRAAVATGFQNVADVLQAIDADSDAYDAAQEAEQAAQALCALTARQHAGGYLDRLALIAAEQDARQAALTLAQAQASRLGNAAALYQALGGGWWHRIAQQDEQIAD